MRTSFALRISVLTNGVLAATLCLCAQQPGTETPATPAKEAQGIPPRATPADYQTKGQAGAVTIAAEFLGHSIPTAQGTLVAEEYVVVEAGMFASPDARITLAASDFSLRINGRKSPVAAEHFGLVFKSLKDPEWGPSAAEIKSKSSVSTGGGGGGRGGGSEPPPSPPKMPLPLRRSMEQRVQKAALPEGDRPLPQAGLIFFPYRGKAESIHSVELIYTGKAGKATLTLQ